MEPVNAEPYFTPRQERRLLKAAAAAIPLEFPNPDRCGCPAPDMVRRLARRRIALPETGDLVDHIATCAPCFNTYKRCRLQRRAVQITGPALAAAIVLLGLALLWRHGSIRPQQQLAHAPAEPVIRASVDYREFSTTRSAHPQRNRAAAPTLESAAVDLTILLPLGTEDGNYAVEIRGSLGIPVAKGNAVAQWNGNAEALSVKLDLRRLPAGTYTLAIRRGDESWRSYPLILEQGK